MIVINLLGEPSSGKSVTAAGLFYELSIHNYSAEIIPEVAKPYAWEAPIINGIPIKHPIFEQQVLLFGEQHRNLVRVEGKREIAIMECPLLMSVVYQEDNFYPEFEPLVMKHYHKFHNINIVIERSHNFDQEGRVHTEKDCFAIRDKITHTLEKYKLPYKKFKTNPHIKDEIFKYLNENEFIDLKQKR